MMGDTGEIRIGSERELYMYVTPGTFNMPTSYQ